MKGRSGVQLLDVRCVAKLRTHALQAENAILNTHYR
jgi:hypothetical protein